MKEAQRLSGSCPMIWTWNGKEFEFITDVLGVAPLGASDGDGSYFPVDHDEYVSIPGARAGRRGWPVRGPRHRRAERSLLSRSDPACTPSIIPPARRSSPTKNSKRRRIPEFRLFGVEQRIYPQAARDDAGRDVLPAAPGEGPALSRPVPALASSASRQLHTLELDFGECRARRRRRPAAERLGRLAGRQHLPRRLAGSRRADWSCRIFRCRMRQGRWVTVNRGYGHAGRQAEDHRGPICSFSPPAARCASSPICASTGTRSS